MVIPRDKLDARLPPQGVPRAHRSRTLTLPRGREASPVEYVTSQPWGAYNWGKGETYRSATSQVNTDLPI